MTSIAERLRAEPPGLHGGGREFWGLSWAALQWLEREARPGMETLETGAGASTIVFAAAGTRHEAVTPDAEEEERVRAACERLGVDHSRVTFRIGPSHELLPELPPRPLDLVLLDGAHGFPYPILDWWHVAPRLRIGARLLLDDAYLPPVAAILDHLRGSAAWAVERALGYRTVVARKLADERPPFDWQEGGGSLSFRYLPARERLVAAVRHRVFSTRPGLALVRLYRRRAGLEWRKTG
ncbi:MAG TPA: class I SAM-dependent methyltransferase [Thermodesulfobacteriota bacterium]|nr:class I SAM-dependent methyltransferase [Thermodesulfobacteriota bacterium]